MAPSILLLYCPFPTLESARAAALALLNERLVACCNILPAGESHYWWEGTLTTSAEHMLVAKTSADHTGALSARLASLHPYDCPAILTLEANSTAPFVQWLQAQLNTPASA